MSRAGRNARRWYMLKGGGYVDKVLGIDRDNLILYHPMDELTGGVAIDKSPEGNDGAYTGVTLGQPGIGDGNTCPYFDGVNDFNNIYSAGLNADFDGKEGTMAVWAKIFNNAVWTDGNVHCLMRLRSDDNNTVQFFKRDTPNNQVTVQYGAGGTYETITATSQSDLDWVFWAVTWSKTADEVILYKNGSMVGSPATSLGTWVGNLNGLTTLVGGWKTDLTFIWNGWLAHPAVWKVALSEPQIVRLATV